MNGMGGNYGSELESGGYGMEGGYSFEGENSARGMERRLGIEFGSGAGGKKRTRTFTYDDCYRINFPSL